MILAALSAAEFGFAFSNVNLGGGIFFGFLAIAFLLLEHRKDR